MNSFLMQAIRQRGDESGILVLSGESSMNQAELLSHVDKLAADLVALGSACVALYADNGIDWILTDLACQQAGIRIVPVPLFFSASQIRHTLASSGADILVTDQSIDARQLNAAPVPASRLALAGESRIYSLVPGRRVQIPAGTQKVTFTSGSTGSPKGVCLSAEQQNSVAASIAESTNVVSPRHLCVLPLSTLLENLAGVYAPLLAGGTVVAPPLAEVGLRGSSELDTVQLLTCITEYQPNSLILVPEILSALTVAAECGWRPPSSLHFVAVGGGKVSPDLLKRARLAGIPAFEGYGLSECSSVVTLNTPGAQRAGSVGRPLPHVAVSIDRGEILVSGSVFLGYADHPESWGKDTVRTGDLGHVDADGYIYISGRAKNQLITSYGRNISPEWVESELLSGPLLQQAVVFGEARPWCAALLLPRDPETSADEIDAWVRRANLRLPDYARVVDWDLLPKPLTSDDGLQTTNGRPKRAAIERAYGRLIDRLYDRKPEASNQ